MRMIDPRQPLAAIQQQREFRRQRRKPRFALQHREKLGAQRRRIEQGRRIAAGSGADHHVAHIVGGGSSCSATLAASRRASAPEQARGHASTSAAINAASCPLRTPRTCRFARLVSSITPAACRALASAISLRLRRAQFAAGQLDPADSAIARGDDAQQPRTRRGPRRRGRVRQNEGGRSLIQDGHRVERRAKARASRAGGLAAASVHPARCWLARTVLPAGLLAGR